MKRHRKKKHNEKVCHAQELSPNIPRTRSQSGQRSNCALNGVSAITVKLCTEANVMKLHRKI